MTAEASGGDTPGAVRVLRALAGAPVTPPVCGLTFVPPEVVGASDAVAHPDEVLARAASSAGVDFVFAPSWEPWAGRLVTRLKREGIAALWVVRGVLWPALEVLGFEAGMIATVRDPDALAPQLDIAAAEMLDAIALGVGLKADAIVVAEDLAGGSGPLLSPDFVADHVMPRLASGAQAASRAGLPSILHSDGEIAVFLRGARQAGFAGVHVGGLGEESFERIQERARRERLSVLGGLGAQQLASLPGAVRAGTRLGILAEAGALLIADDGGVTTRAEYAALLAGFAAARGLPEER